MDKILKKINLDRISAENVFEFLQNKQWDFQKQEEYLLTKLKIDFENPKFWYFLSLIFYENYMRNNTSSTLLENALYCFNKPFEQNKNKGEIILCDSFQNPKELFALEFSEYLDFLNDSIAYLMLIYKKPVFYKGFSLPNVNPTKPELIERFEIIIQADFNELIEKNEKTFVKQIKNNEFKLKVLSILKRNKKIKLNSLAERLNLDLSFIQEILKNLVIEKKIDCKIKNDQIIITKDSDFKESSFITLSDKGQCTICREIIEKKSIKCNFCSSKFHVRCFLKWIQTNKACPFCQKKLEF
ncbi:MAG: RING finger domain-containing protein [Candidatus Helarchaeota archaeon]